MRAPTIASAKIRFSPALLIAAAKFTENSAMTLRMNFSWKNFHAGNPRALRLALNGLPR
jgi:hypothetical protein